MTGAPAPDQLDIEAIVARIRRDRAESDKFQAEQRKLIAEAQKYDRDRWLAPVLALIAAIGAITAATASILNLLK